MRRVTKLISPALNWSALFNFYNLKSTMQTPVNTFKLALQNKQAQIGLWLSLADSYATEISAGAGLTGC